MSTQDPRRDPWSYQDDTWATSADLVGYKVEATDGSIGKIDAASHETGDSYVVVDTGPWIFGTRRLIPAGAVGGVDHEGRVVTVELSKDQVRSAPEYDSDTWDDTTRSAHEDYYGGFTSRDPGGPMNPL